MTEGEMLLRYKCLTPVEGSAFARRPPANLAGASLFALVLLALAFSGSTVPQPAFSAATSPGLAASVSGPTPFELMVGAAPDRLPTEQVDAPY